MKKRPHPSSATGLIQGTICVAWRRPPSINTQAKSEVPEWLQSVRPDEIHVAATKTAFAQKTPRLEENEFVKRARIGATVTVGEIESKTEEHIARRSNVVGTTLGRNRERRHEDVAKINRFGAFEWTPVSETVG